MTHEQTVQVMADLLYEMGADVAAASRRKGVAFVSCKQ